MSKVLVTGVAGFIGSHVAEQCIKLGFNVTGVDDLSGGFIENIPHGVKFIKGNVCDYDFVKSLWNKTNYDYVYHLAAYAAEGLSHYIRYFNYENNLLGSISLINQSIRYGVKCFVFTSSIAVYGRNQLPMREELVPKPEDPYGISKYAVELDLAAASRSFGLKYVVFRPHNVYGERQNIADRYRNVIGIYMNKVMQDKPMPVFGDGHQTRAFSYISDVAPIIAIAPQVPGSYGNVFNIGADQPYSILDVAQYIASAFGRKCDLEHLPARNEVDHAYANHDKLKHVFKTKEPISLQEGINIMAAWVRKVGVRKPCVFNNIEVGKGMPEYWKKYVD